MLYISECCMYMYTPIHKHIHIYICTHLFVYFTTFVLVVCHICVLYLLHLLSHVWYMCGTFLIHFSYNLTHCSSLCSCSPYGFSSTIFSAWPELLWLMPSCGPSSGRHPKRGSPAVHPKKGQ